MIASQQRLFDEFHCDINRSITIYSLAMRVFLTHFDEENSIIMNKHHYAEFIHESYFGGHTDIYRLRAQFVYVYDINVLYPFACLWTCLVVNRIRHWINRLS